MMDALIAGRLHGQPTARTGKSGKPFAVARVRAAGGDGESLFVTVIAFDEAPCKALQALRDGDSVALSGSLTPKVWTDKEGNTRPALDLVAHQVLTSYHVTSKRRAVHPQERPQDSAPPPPEHWPPPTRRLICRLRTPQWRWHPPPQAHPAMRRVSCSWSCPATASPMLKPSIEFCTQ